MFHKNDKEPVFEIFMHDAIIYSVCAGGCTYTLQSFKQYKDSSDLCIAVVTEKEGGGHNIDRKTLSIPYNENRMIEPFEIDGVAFLWDYRDQCLRYRPKVDSEKRYEINKWMHTIDDELMWIEKKYAEKNLSSACLGYAWDDGAGNYLWGIQDKSAYTAYLELYQVSTERNKEADWDAISKDYYDIINVVGTYNKSYYVDYFEKEYLDNYEENKYNPSILKTFDFKKLYNREIVETN